MRTFATSELQQLYQQDPAFTAKVQATEAQYRLYL
jgi:hypothetical protein